MPAPRINGIVESCLFSTDLPRSVRFYQDKLGLRLLESLERLCVFSVADKQVLLIFRSGGTPEPVPTPGGMIPPHEAAGQLHFAFAIAKEDLAAWEDRLIAQGIKIESKVTWPAGGQSLYFRDPDNHLVELATPGIWEVY
jgi:catechol 2,3-dioxygenase-like lactoylglutathione lyase family enzyme